MLRILLICQFAASSRLLVERMKEASARSGGEEHAIACESITELEAVDFGRYDVVLLAPQARHYLKKVREKTSIPVESIDMRAYGLADGSAVLRQAQQILSK